MSSGLIALLDDVAALTKVAAASVDDVVGYAAKAGAKSAGVVIDDAAVTPRYVVGFSADRELPIVGKIALGSLRNKLLFLLPAALLLGLFAPWAITPLLMLGGLYLAFEGAEKLYEAVVPHGHDGDRAPTVAAADPAKLEAERVAGAIRTDFILSAEIMAITLHAIPATGFWSQAAVLAIVGIGITAAVYGAVALLVKADDLGVLLARNRSPTLLGRLARRVGLWIVVAMPVLLEAIALVGTAAMLWVGGGILVHGLEVLGLPWLAHLVESTAAAAGRAVPLAPAAVEWLAAALTAGLVGLAIGGLLLPIVGLVLAPLCRLLSGIVRSIGTSMRR